MSFESRRMRTREKEKSPSFFLFFVLLLLLFVSYFQVSSVSDVSVKSGTYTISKGVTLADLPTIFRLDVGTLRYKLWLRFFAPPFSALKAGTYEVDKATSLADIFRTTLAHPVQTNLTITVLPGWNIYDIDDALSSKKIIDPGSLLLAARDHFSTLQKKYPFLENRLSLEGFLYPDTYRILPTSDAYIILDRLLSEWQKKIGSSYISLGKNAYDTLILASIVEREERDTEQQSVVAGILAKRVKEGIPMGADATVCYGYAKTQKQCTPSFIGEVIYKKDPYNTRNSQGYPPTPISSVSLDTWNATVNKKSSAYYYYLHDNEGNIHYARTLEEHNANKKKYLQ